MKIACIVVLYNKSIYNSSTLNFFIKRELSNVCVYVYDNSTKELNNKYECKKNNFKYFTTYKNVGISRAYNTVVKQVLNDNADIDYVMMLDDDACLTEEYFRYLNRLLKDQVIEVGVPIIKSNGQVLSPSKVTFYGRIKPIKKITELNNKNITAINNGMVININIFKQFSYDDNLFVDYVDHDFMRKLRENNVKITVFDFFLIHNMSIVDNTIDVDSRLNRFKIYSADLKRYYSKNLGEQVFVRSSIFFRAIKYCVHYKDMRFLHV